MRRITLNLFILCLALLTASSVSANVIVPAVGADEEFAVADGDVFTDNGGIEGNYADCGCLTSTLLTGQGQLSLNFTDFGIFGNLDWMRIYDGSDANAPILYGTKDGDMGDGDQDLDDFIASNGSSTVGGTTNQLYVEFYATTVGSDVGFQALVQAATEVCEIMCPNDITATNDPGECGAFVNVPPPALSDDCIPSSILVDEGFDACSEPAGWGVDDGTGTPGGGFSGVTSDGGTVGDGIFYDATDVPGGGDNAAMEGCRALIDDDFANNIGFGCIIIPVNLPAGFFSPSVSANMTNQAFAGNGDLFFDYWDGSDWINLATATDDQVTVDVNGAPLSANSDLTLRFCYDDEGFNFAWGAGLDNLEVQAVDPNGVPMAVNDYNGTTDASDFYPVGTTEVTFSVPGQTASCTMTVTVEDTEAPTLTCPSDATINLDAGECNQVYNFQTSATDNCPSTPFSIAGPYCDPCEDPQSAFALACAPFAQNSIIQLVQIGDFTGTINEMCYNQETFGQQPLATINLYADDGSGDVPYTGGGFTPIATQEYQSSVLDNGDCVCVPFDNPAVADGSFTAVWVEVFTPGLTLNSRVVNTPMTCDGNSATGLNSYIVAPACGLATPGTFASIGFPNADASFSLIVQPLEVTPEPDPNAPTGFNQFEDGDLLPIGFHCFQYAATDEAGNTSTCTWCVTVNEYPDPVSELACNDNVNISLDENCEAIVTADMILEGGPYGCYEDYVVSIEGGDNMLDASDVGQVYEVMVTDPETGNSCWGYITVEDKQIPALECAAYEVACSENPLPGTLVDGVIDFAFEPGLPITAGTQSTDVVVSSPSNEIQDIDIDLDIAHTWIGDLTLSVTSPSGTTVLLFDNIGGPGFGCAGNDIDVVFDDEAAATYEDLDGTCNNAPAVEGTFQPLEALAAFDGEDPNGTWTIEVTDNFFGDDGNLNAITLSMKLPNAQEIQFPLPDDVAISPPSGEGPFTVLGFDPCGPVTLTFEDVSAGGDVCDGDFADIIFRNWTATDPSGNTSTCQDTFFVTRNGVADVVAPPNYDGLDAFTLNCGTPYSPFIPFGPDNWDINQNNYPDPEETGGPGGICENLWFGFTDQVIHSCGVTVLRNWTIVDECTGEMVNVIQKIKVVDNAGPVIECVENIELSTSFNSCDASVEIPLPISITDDCDTNAIEDFTVTTSAGEIINDIFSASGLRLINLPIGVHTLTYTANDGCGNVGECVTTITVSDQVAPVATCDVNTVVSLGSDGTAIIYAETFDDGSYDNCGDVSLAVRRIRPNGGADRSCEFGNGSYRPFVSFCCEDVSKDELMVEMLVTDQSGNSNVCMVNVDVVDKLAPFIQAPADVTVSCDFPFDVWTLDESFGSVVTPQNGQTREVTVINDPEGLGTTEILDGYAADNCDVSVEELPFNDNNLECGQGTIVRVWRAFDKDNNRSQASQRITIVDFDPFFICDNVAKCTGAPSPVCNLSRYTEVDDANWPCDILIEVCTTDVMSLDPDQLAMSDMRNENTRRPVSEAAFPEVFDDNCSQIAISYEDEVFTVVQDACFKILRHWTIIDWCQFDEDVPPLADQPRQVHAGRWEYTQTIKVLDAEAPEFMNCEDVTFCDTAAFDCTGFADLALQVMDCTPLDQLVASYRIDAFFDPSAPPSYDIFGQGTDASGNYPFGTHKIQWFVEDLCGNTSTCEYLFTTSDCKKPSPVCINGLSSVTMPATGCITLSAENFDASSFDNCSDELIFSFTSDVDSTDRVFCCDELGTVEVEIWVTDENGNQDFCTTFVSIQDPNNICGDPSSTIAGLIETEAGNPVKEVEVILDNDNANMAPYMTNEDGVFSFNEMDDFQAYEVIPGKNIEILDGVTTYDIALIQRHVLELVLLDSPYKLIAADANRDGAINILDVVEIRKVILGLSDEFTNNTSWRFVDQDQTFPSGLTAPPVDVRETILFDNLYVDELETDFIGVKVGDVNGSADGGNASGADNRNFGNVIEFEMTDRIVKAGEEIRVPVTSSNFEEVLGYQFTLMMNNSILEFVGVESGVIDMTNNNIGQRYADRGMITVSWNDVNAVSAKAGEVLFTMVLKANGEGTLSEAMDVSSAKTVMEAYKANNVVGVALAFNNELEGADAFVVYQNRPNPFNERTIIRFNMPIADNAIITIMDVTGKIVSRYDMDCNKGMNQFELTREQLSASGVYYYQIATNDYTATKKMVVE